VLVSLVDAQHFAVREGVRSKAGIELGSEGRALRGDCRDTFGRNARDDLMGPTIELPDFDRGGQSTFSKITGESRSADSKHVDKQVGASERVGLGKPAR
jgi:hypothetical protein